MSAPHVTAEKTLQEKVLQASVVEQLAGGITGWSQTYDQIAPGQFRGSLIEKLDDGVQVFAEASSHALVQTCCVPQGYLWFGIPNRDKAVNVSIEGQTLAPEYIAVRPGGVEFQLATPNDFEFLGIVVPIELLQEQLHVAGVGSFDAQVLYDSYIAKLEQSALFRLRSDVEKILIPRKESDLIDAIPVTVRDYAMELLIDMFLADINIPKQKVSVQYLSKLTKRVRGYLEANRYRAVTVSELCDSVGASRRTIQSAFSQAWGTNPKNYLRARGLNACRRELLNRKSDLNSVGDIAANFGFQHHGQFGLDYKLLFGESPSETLKRRYFKG